MSLAAKSARQHKRLVRAVKQRLDRIDCMDTLGLETKSVKGLHNLLKASFFDDLVEDCRAVLTLLENEGRDTGMGGPLSDLRGTIEEYEELAKD